MSGLVAGSQQVSESADRQGGVEEVGTERRDDADPAAGLDGRGAQAREHVRPLGLVLDEREDLLELIEDDDELGVGVGKHALDAPDQPELVPLEVLHQRRRRLDGDAEERGLELSERVRAGEHVDDVPAIGAGQRPAPESPARGPRGRWTTSPSPTVRPRRGTVNPPRTRRAVRTSLSVTTSRPKKSPASASRKARRPL